MHKHPFYSCIFKSVVFVLALTLGISAAYAQADVATQQAAAEKVINDFIASSSAQPQSLQVKVVMDLTATTEGCDKYSYSLSGSTLTVHASNGVSACRGFYDFMKANGAGICSWSANRFEAPAQYVKTSQAEYTSPYRDHQYFNVVTSGYSTPYWDEQRWDEEITWMAMHGIDMPLMLIGSEQIYRKVFKELYQVTDAQLDAWEVGPAHLPWMRMGNLAGNSFDGPLGQNWHDRQNQIAKHVLKRMAELGMKPIVPAFGGFVPQAVAQKIQSKGGHYDATGWDWIPASYKNYRLTPTSDGEFKKIGQRFIELWDEEYESSYGTFKYYLSDSFNEMTVPNDPTTLTGYGDQIYTAIKDGSKNSDAVWVTQGWEFIYGSGKWTNGSTTDAKFKALTKNVPAHNFMVLSMSPEYGGYGNKKWELYDNYAGKDWINTMLPNMGGKNFWTGKLQDYATSFPNTLWNSAGSKNCTGWGMTMEGIEYNEMLYELIADMGWEQNHTKNLDQWVKEYGTARYGNYSKELQALHQVMRNTVYSSYIDHQNFGWQGNGKSNKYYESGNIGTTNETFLTGFETYFSADNIAALKAGGALSATLKADLMEFAAFYAAARVEKICKRIMSAKNMNDKDGANALLKKLEQVMLDMDYVLSGHPLFDEAKWEAKAVAMAGADKDTQEKYRRNARRIVSVWYGTHQNHEPVNDYASRIYSGLLRDYYLPRLYAELNGLVNGTSYDLRAEERKFVPAGDTKTPAPALSPLVRMIDGKRVEQPVSSDKLTDADFLDLVETLVAEAKEAGSATVEKNVLQLSNEHESHWYAIHTQAPAYLDNVFTATGDQAGVTAPFAISTLNAQTSQYWRLVDNGDDTFYFENREGQQLSFDAAYKTYRYGIRTDAKLAYDETNCRYAFKMTKASSWMKYDGTLKSATYLSGGKFTDEGSWTLQAVDAAVNEVSRQSDYDRYRARFEGYTTWGEAALIGQPGQPKSRQALEAAIARLQTRDLALETYTEFLHNKWYAQVNEAYNVPAGIQARKLFYLVLSAMDLPVIDNESLLSKLRTAMSTAQQAMAAGDEDACSSASTALQTALKNYIAKVPSFPYVSPEPVDGKFRAASKALIIRNRAGGGAGYISTGSMTSGAFNLTGTNRPTSSEGYWVVCGNDAEGYTFYNIKEGAKKVLGMTGSEDGARAKMYDNQNIPTGVTTRFFYRTNQEGFAVFYTGANNAWNKRGNYLALWNDARVFQTDLGSTFTIEVVPFDFGEDPLAGIAPAGQITNSKGKASNPSDLLGRRAARKGKGTGIFIQAGAAFIAR